jgi:hypothetical protein
VGPPSLLAVAGYFLLLVDAPWLNGVLPTAFPGVKGAILFRLTGVLMPTLCADEGVAGRLRDPVFALFWVVLIIVFPIADPTSFF